MNILLVEDDALVAKMVKATMTKWNQKVLLASSGQAAVSMAGENTFDLVLLDIMLPDGLGYDFIPEIKKFQPDIKIITMTGYNTPEMETKARAQGINYYMAKPINLTELKSILDHLVKKKEPALN